MRKTVNIKGVIVGDDEKWIYDWFGIAATSPSTVREELEAAGGDEVEVIVNSPGGSVYAGNEIYAQLKSYSGKSVGKIVSLAASAASYAVLGCDTVVISPLGQIMIHNAWTRVFGDYRDMEHTADYLQKVDTSIINVYRLKTGKTEDELRAMMDKETWMTAQEALEHKFVDEILFDDQKQLAASASTSNMLPPEVINKIRQMIKQGELAAATKQIMEDSLDSKTPEEEGVDNSPHQKTKATMDVRLKLIKLKGKVIEE